MQLTNIFNRPPISICSMYAAVVSCIIILLSPAIGYSQEYGDFPYEQSFLSTAQPAEISKPGTTGSTTNAATFTADGLRLTPAAASRFGAVFVNNRRFGSANGIKIEFEYMVYGGNGADGFSVFFFDESEANPQIGSYGAGIGYTYNRSLMRHNPNDRKPGLRSAYLGIAFDSFGNFKQTRFLNEEIKAGIGISGGSESHVTLRGAEGAPYPPSSPLPGMGSGYTGYPVLVTQSTKAGNNGAYVVLNEAGDYDFNAASSYGDDFYLRGGAVFNDGDTDNPAYRKAFIDIYPIDGEAGGMYITVRVQHGENISTVIDNYQYRAVTKYKETAIVSTTRGDDIYGQVGEGSEPIISDVIDLPSAIPNFLRIGFAASTGQRYDIHMIKNLRITLPGAAEAYNDFDTTQVDIPVTLNPLDNDIAYQGVISENMVGSSEYINPASFRFMPADGSAPDSSYSHQSPEGLWQFDPQTGSATFAPAAGFEGDASIHYSIKGGLPGSEVPFSDEAYRSLPAVITVTVAADVCPPVLVWTGSAGSSWENSNNWYPNSVPANCTDVYIPGDAAVFPNLLRNETNTCRNIYFMPGAQLGNSHWLHYEKAFIQLDYGAGSLASRPAATKEELEAAGRDNITSEQRVRFGAAASGITLDRGRWNMLSAPLGNITTGDFAFGGFPFSYIKKFDADGSASSYIMGTWADFNNETDLAFQPGQGFGHYYYPYVANTPYGMDNSAGGLQWEAAKNYNGLTAGTPVHIDGSSEFGLAQSNGVLHLPYFADEYLSRAHRMHQYAGTETSGTSTFNFFYYSPLVFADFLRFNGNTENAVRTNAAYRFITEGWDGEYNAGNFSANEIVLVGNPYMSALDFDAFYAENTSKIKQVYHIYQAPNTYITYMGDGSDSRFIAPMQSFLVETVSSGELNLTFTAATTAKTNVGTKLRSSRAEAGSVLAITAGSRHGETTAYVRQSAEAGNGLDNHDFSRLIDKPDNTPRVYTLAEMDNGRQRALSMNTIQDYNTMIPIGLAAISKEDITLTISGMDIFDTEVFFIDTAEGVEKKISGMETFSYTFRHDFSAEKPEVEDRFKLRFSYGITTGFEDHTPQMDITAYASGNDLMLISGASNPIRTAAVFDLQGRSLAQMQTGGASCCKLENVLKTTGIYIVKVQTDREVKKIKIIR